MDAFLENYKLPKLEQEEKGNLKKNETSPFSKTRHKDKLKCIKDLKVRPETIKPLGQNTGNNLFDIRLSSIFLGVSPEAREAKAKINY